MNRKYVAYAYVYVYVSYKNEILKKREDVGKRLGGYWEEVGRTATNRQNPRSIPRLHPVLSCLIPHPPD